MSNYLMGQMYRASQQVSLTLVKKENYPEFSSQNQDWIYSKKNVPLIGGTFIILKRNRKTISLFLPFQISKQKVHPNHLMLIFHLNH
jgi:hypothetical protein